MALIPGDWKFSHSASFRHRDPCLRMCDRVKTINCVSYFTYRDYKVSFLKIFHFSMDSILWPRNILY